MSRFFFLLLSLSFLLDQFGEKNHLSIRMFDIILIRIEDFHRQIHVFKVQILSSRREEKKTTFETADFHFSINNWNRDREQTTMHETSKQSWSSSMLNKNFIIYHLRIESNERSFSFVDNGWWNVNRINQLKIQM